MLPPTAISHGHRDRLCQLLARTYGYESTLYETYALAQRVAGLEGDIVECGIAAGAQLCAMKLAAPLKTAWGYDSFDGIELAGPHDTHQPGIGAVDPNRMIPENRLVSSGVSVHRRQEVENSILFWGFRLDEFRLVEGWVQRTMARSTNLPEKVAILRLDMDMHDPTRCAMEHLWPRLVPGGVLIVDDWSYKGARKAVNDYLDLVGYLPDWQTPRHTGWLIKTSTHDAHQPAVSR